MLTQPVRPYGHDIQTDAHAGTHPRGTAPFAEAQRGEAHLQPLRRRGGSHHHSLEYGGWPTGDRAHWRLRALCAVVQRGGAAGTRVGRAEFVCRRRASRVGPEVERRGWPVTPPGSRLQPRLRTPPANAPRLCGTYSPHTAQADFERRALRRGSSPRESRAASGCATRLVPVACCGPSDTRPLRERRSALPQSPTR